jgi:hypothetical protein
MTTKPPSGLAASGSANEAESDQITKELSEDGSEIALDPSEDVTVEATEDVTTEAVGQTPHPTLRPGTVGVSPEQRAPTLLGVPINSLPLPGVTTTSSSGADDEDATRTIDYNEEITVLAQAEPADPLAALDAALERPSVTDDDEEETKVEPAEAAMKAAASIDDVTTALSAQANLEREKALRRSVPAASPSDDLEFADPDADDQEQDEESLDDELDDGDEVISAGGAIEEEADDLGDSEEDTTNGGVATSTFLKPADTTGLSGLLNPRRPPTGGRDGFGARLPTPYPPPQSPIPGPSTSPFASRLGAAPAGSPYSARATGTSMPAIQVPPPSGKATTESEPGFFSKQVPMGFVFLIGAGTLLFGFGIRGFFSGGKSAPTPTVVTTKQVAAPVAPAVVVVPVQGTTPAAETPPADTTTGNKPAVVPSAEAPGAVQAGATPENQENGEGLWRPAAKKPAARPHKPAADAAEEALLKPKPAVAKEPRPAATPKPVVAKEPKPAMTASAKPAKKPAKAWVDPFAN